MTCSHAGEKSKFRSSFGPIQQLPEAKPFTPKTEKRRKIVGYFDAVKNGSFSTNTSIALDNKELNDNVKNSDQNPKKYLIEEPIQEKLQSVEPLGDTEEDDGREPKLYVDVNVANFGLQRIIVYEGDTVESLVTDFVKRCPIDESMIEKLKTLLQQQIDGVLERIEEDEGVSD